MALIVFSYIYLFIIGLTSNIVGIAYSSSFWLKVGIAYSFTHYKLYVTFLCVFDIKANVHYCRQLLPDL